MSLFCLAVFFSTMSIAQPLGWTHTSQVNVTENSGSTLVNYQVKLIVNTAALVTAGQMNIDGSDIRFGKDPAGNVLYNYWIDTAMNTTATVIWIKVDSLFASQVRTMYMFYGNAGATAASNITGTFIGPFSSTDSITGGSVGGAVRRDQRGFRFSPNEPIVVTEFGKYEPTGSTRYLTLFDFSSQTLLQQIQVSGAASQYNYAPLAIRMWLSQGVQYLMEIYQGPTDAYYDRASSQINSRLTYYDMRYCNACTENTFPTSVLTGQQFGYADFLFYTRQIVSPEPTASIVTSPLVLSIPGLVSVCAGSRAGVSIGDTATGAIGRVSYRWSPAAGLSDSTSAFTVFTGASSQNYTLYATDTAGNTATATVQVNVVQPSLQSDTISICPRSSYMLNNHSYTTAGDYIDTLRAAASSGCDSIVHTHLVIKTLSNDTVRMAICPNSPYTFNSHSYSTAGTYSDTLAAAGANGCDSIAVLVLSVKTVGHGTLTAAICPGTSYSYHGRSFTVGNHIDTLSGMGVNGCDSIVTLQLFPKTVGHSSLTASVCAGSSYLFNGQSYSIAGTYSDTIRGAGSNGCDSIATLHLSLKTVGQSAVNATVCSTSYTFHGHTYTTGGTYADTITGGSSSGCDSIISLVLNFSSHVLDTIRASTCQGTPYSFGGNGYLTAGTYRDTVLGGSSLGCDSITILILTVNPLPSPVISQVGSDTMKTGNFSSYQWLLSNSPVAGATHSVLVALSTGSYRVLVIDSNGCRDTSAVYNYVSSGINELGTAELKIYPNPNTGIFTLMIPTQYVGSQIMISDMTGRNVLSIKASQERENIDMADLSGGVYLLSIGQSTVRFTVVR